MKTKIISILFLLLLIAITGKAQEQVQAQEQVKVEEQPQGVQKLFKVLSVKFTSGWYNPKMDYWNNTYLPAVGVTETFVGNISIGGDVTFALPYNLRARVGISYWSDKVKGNESSTINSLHIDFTRFRLGAVYAPKVASFSGFQPYIGIDGQFFLIQNKLDDGSKTTEQQGQDYSFAPVIGIDRSFGNFIVAAEFMYNLGGYTQELKDGISTVKQKISIAGPEVTISLGYSF